VAQSG